MTIAKPYKPNSSNCAYCLFLHGSDGILCGDRYRPIQYWCIGTADLCNTGDNIISIDHPELCRNRTYWRINNFSCDQSGELTYAVGSRCS